MVKDIKRKEWSNKMVLKTGLHPFSKLRDPTIDLNNTGSRTQWHQVKPAEMTNLE